MNKYSIDYEMKPMTNKKGLDGKKRTGCITITASSETAAKHKFYQTHKSNNGFWITDITLMKEGK